MYESLAKLAPTACCETANSAEHAVQFYESEQFLLEAVQRFVAGALRSGHAAVVVATQPHFEDLESRWRADGFDLQAARDRGQYVPLEAAETLAQLMVDGMPHEKPFGRLIGSAIAAAAARYPRVVAFGEMVALLAAEGRHAAAVRLEALWNSLGRTHPFSLLCAYPLRDFAAHAQSEAFQDVCGQHSRVIPAESYVGLDSASERLREISSLQQKATALEATVRECRQMQEALREAESGREEFLAVIAHELRNPLAPIRNATEIIRAAEHDRAAVASARALIERQVDQLVRFIDDALDLNPLTAPSMQKTANNDTPPEEPPTSSTNQHAGAGQKRILIADDNWDAAESLAMLLELDGHIVLTASDGADALEKAGRFRPDVMLLDLGMPRLNGCETARMARSQWWGHAVKLVALTGWGQPEDQRRVREAGFDHHLVKPCDPDVLRALLR